MDISIYPRFALSDEIVSSLNFGEVTDGQTERMHMSPPCIRTGVLKKKTDPLEVHGVTIVAYTLRNKLLNECG